MAKNDPSRYETMSDRDLAVSALRQALIEPLKAGQAPRDAASIARTLLEVSGALGKHSKAPVEPDGPLHEASRADLEELAK